MKQLRLGAAVILSLGLFAVPATIGYSRVQAIRVEYDKAPPPRESTQTAAWKDAADAMAAHSNTLTTSAVGLLGWIALVGLGTSIRQIPWRAFVLLLLAPAAGMLLVSTWAGEAFQRRLTYLRLKETIGYDNSLNALLGVQSDYLVWSLLPLSFVTFVFFVSILRELPPPTAQRQGANS